MSYRDPLGMARECFSFWTPATEVTVGAHGNNPETTYYTPGYSTYVCTETGSFGGGYLPVGLGGGGGGAQPSTVFKRGATCTAAAIDAAAATAGDLVSLSGVGMLATRGTRGANFAMKAMRSSQWLLRDRLTGALSPTNSGSLRSVAKWQANALVGVSWMATSNALQGESFDFWEEAAGLIPGVNAYMKLSKAFDHCF